MFLESILFKNLKISKTQFCLVLATQSRVSQVVGLSCFFAGYFWRLVRKWKVQSRGLHRDFRGSARDSLVGRPSNCEKHLEIFSQFCLWVFWRLALATCWRLTSVVKNACSAFRNQFLNLFNFPSNFLWLFTFSLNLNSPKHSVSLFTTSIFALFTSKSSRKRYGLSFPHLISHVLSFIFVNICVDVLFFSLWVCFGFWVVLVWIVEVLSLCELVSIDRFIYYHVLVSLR